MSTETVEHGTPSGKIFHDSRDNSYKSTFFGGGHSALGCLGYTFHTYVGTTSKAGAWKSQQALSDRHKSTIWAPLASEVFSSLVMSLVSIIIQESFCHGNSSGIDLFELNLSSFCKFWTKILGKPVQPSPLAQLTTLSTLKPNLSRPHIVVSVCLAVCLSPIPEMSLHLVFG